MEERLPLPATSPIAYRPSDIAMRFLSGILCGHQHAFQGGLEGLRSSDNPDITRGPPG